MQSLQAEPEGPRLSREGKEKPQSESSRVKRIKSTGGEGVTIVPSG